MQPDKRLDSYPTKNGFRLRGLAATRIETFTDAAFAFALTLLVLASDIPRNYAELSAALQGIPTFVLSATLLMMFWAAHRTWSRRYGLDDVATILLSCLLVFTVLVYVYPLRFMFNSMMAWITYLSGVPLTAEPLQLRPAHVNRLFVVYGAGFVAMCGSILLLNLHAWRKREDLQLNDLERFDTKSEIKAWTIVAGVGAFSILIAAVTPPTWIGIPGWAYALLAIIMPLYSKRAARRRLEIPTGS